MTSQPAVDVEEATVAEVVEEFVAAAGDGRALNRTGRVYRPSALRDVAGILRRHLVGELGGLRLRDVQPEDVQRLVDDLAARDLSLSRRRSVVSAIRALFAYARERGLVTASPAETIDVGPREPPRWEDEDDLEDLDALDDEPDDAFDDDEPPAASGTWTWEDRPAAPATRATPLLGHRPLPEVAVGLVLRLVVVVFLILTLASLAQALLTPA